MITPRLLEVPTKKETLPKVYLGVPTYDGRVHEGIVGAIFGAGRTPLLGRIQIESGSWLTRNFNSCLANALNARQEGFTHFCLLHEDLPPVEGDWLEKMVLLAEANKADVLSVVSPLKFEKGLTSTALDEPVGDQDQRYRVKRLTLHEIYQDFAPTFTHEKLLINTGLMLIDLRKPWVEQVSFQFVDAIVKDKAGNFVAAGFPEDWNFSRAARALGASIWATREVAVTHLGGGRWGNGSGWGTLKADT